MKVAQIVLPVLLKSLQVTLEDLAGIMVYQNQRVDLEMLHSRQTHNQQSIEQMKDLTMMMTLKIISLNRIMNSRSKIKSKTYLYYFEQLLELKSKNWKSRIGKLSNILKKYNNS